MANAGKVEIRLDLQLPSAGHSRQKPTSTTKTTTTTTPLPTPTLKERCILCLKDVEAVNYLMLVAVPYRSTIGAWEGFS